MTEFDNIVLVVADTLSAFHMGCFGYERDTTPFLDELADENFLCRFAYSSSSWTVPSHASIFSGEEPQEHDCVHGSLSFESDSFVEDLKEEGYSTLGISANHLVSEDLGFDRGFDTLVSGGVDVKMRGMGFKDLQKMHSRLDDVGGRKDKAKSIIEKSVRSRSLSPIFQGLNYFSKDSDERVSEFPLDIVKNEVDKNEKNFVFINYLDPHIPYEPPVYIAEKWVENPEKAISEHKDWLDENDFKWNKTPENEDDVRGLYDAEIRYMDSKVEELYKYFQENFENTLFIFTSDHGENIGDYGLFAHQCGVWEKLIRVPLIIAGDSIESGEKVQNVSLSELGELIRGEKDVDKLGSDRVFAEYNPILNSSGIDEDEYSGSDIEYAKNRSRCMVDAREGIVLNSDIPNYGFEAEEKGFTTENKFSQVSDLRRDVKDHFSDGSDLSSDVEDKVKDNLEKLGYI